MPPIVVSGAAFKSGRSGTGTPEKPGLGQANMTDVRQAKAIIFFRIIISTGFLFYH